MFAERVVLSQPLSEAYAQELERRIFFVSDQIVDFSLIKHEGLIREIEVSTSKQMGSEELAAKINYLVANDVTSQRQITPKVIWRADGERGYHDDLFEQMLAQGIAYEVGEGQVCVGEPFIALMDYFDRQLRAIAVDVLGGREYRYPTLIPTEVLDRCGYFNSFPQYLMFVTRLHSDVDTYREFLDSYKASGDVREFALSQCQNLDYCLPPTMCFHTYHQFRNTQFAPGESRVVTAKGKSFRFESRYHRTLERLWDFTIREIVFMGTREHVLECRQTFMRHAFQLMEQLGMTGFCEVANDPFFCNEDTAAKIWSQKMLELKYELRANVTQDRTIAVGSFNFHEEFFGHSFNIQRDDNDWIRTGCVGFGLERLTYAFLCQYGLDQQQWPQQVIEGVQGE